jgi:hypothetical protein
MQKRSLKKTIFTLNIDNYAPEITDVTYPLIDYYAMKIGADRFTITERKFPDWPPVYEKLQIYELGQQMGNDWNIYIDSDALVHPETIDFTQYLTKDTVAHNGVDMAAVRWRYDKYFLRDGRNIGSCNWLTMGSDQCIDLWKPIDDLTLEEALGNIFPTVEEAATVITPEHLIDDYTLSRNIAKYGLKCTTVNELLPKIGLKESNFFWHLYTISIEEKVKLMKEVVEKWRLDAFWGAHRLNLVSSLGKMCIGDIK